MHRGLLQKSGNQPFLWSSAIWRGPNLFSLVFTHVGCLARFYLSLKLNRYIAGFPLGTFTANLGGTMIIGVAYSLQHAPLGSSGLGGYSLVACQVLQGSMDGFWGSMTTVSTWVLELSDPKRRHAYIYGIVCFLVPLAMLVIEIGSLRWTKGFTSPVCFSYN
jgi:fluoride ion exporter CrcB/FEX